MGVVAFSLFTAAAFSWPLPWLDRAGVALLGAAFLALAVGRVVGRTRPSSFRPRLRSGAEPVLTVQAFEREIDETPVTFGADGWR